MIDFRQLLQQVFAQHSAEIATLHCCHRLEGAGWTREQIGRHAETVSFLMHCAFRPASIYAEEQACRVVECGLPALVFAAYLAVILHVGDVAATALDAIGPEK